MNKFKKIISSSLALIMVLSLASCKTSDKTEIIENSSESSASLATPEPSVESSTPEAEGITVTDQTGREVTILKTPEKIVSGYYITTTTMMALGLTDKLVGIEAKADGRPIYSMVAPKLLELPNVGSAKDFDVEGCIALEPDLLVAPARIKDSAETIADLGIPVLLVSPESHAEYLAMVNLIGTATGTIESAEKLISYYENEMAEVTALTEPLTEKPVVYIGSNGSYLSTAPKDMYQTSLIRMAGGINAGDAIEGNNWAEISYEQLLVMNPDVIIIPSTAEYTKEDILADKEIAELKAVKNGAIYTMPGFIEAWDSPGPAGTLGLRWMLYALHEDLYSKEQLDEKVASFYKEFYALEEIDLTKVTK